MTGARDRIVALLRDRGASPRELSGGELGLFETAIDRGPVAGGSLEVRGHGSFTFWQLDPAR